MSIWPNISLVVAIECLVVAGSCSFKQDGMERYGSRIGIGNTCRHIGALHVPESSCKLCSLDSTSSAADLTSNRHINHTTFTFLYTADRILLSSLNTYIDFWGRNYCTFESPSQDFRQINISGSFPGPTYMHSFIS